MTLLYIIILYRNIMTGHSSIIEYGIPERKVYAESFLCHSNANFTREWFG